jgi:hypothetical protein
LVDGSAAIQQRPHHHIVSSITGDVQGRGTACLSCSRTTAAQNRNAIPARSYSRTHRAQRCCARTPSTHTHTHHTTTHKYRHHSHLTVPHHPPAHTSTHPTAISSRGCTCPSHHTNLGLVDGSAAIQQRPHHRIVTSQTCDAQRRPTVFLPYSRTATAQHSQCHPRDCTATRRTPAMLCAHAVHTHTHTTPQPTRTDITHTSPRATSPTGTHKHTPRSHFKSWVHMPQPPHEPRPG